jgi:hypothetical protein
MVRFTTTILKFDKQGEKTGWTYIHIPAATAQVLMPGNKKPFRVKGFFDAYRFEGLSLLAMGEGDFILALNAAIRKEIKKGKGATITVQMEVDDKPLKIPEELKACLVDEPGALATFNSFAPSHQKYFINWINDAKTEPTRTRRLAQTLNALVNKMDFGTMIRSIKEERKVLNGIKKL